MYRNKNIALLISLLTLSIGAAWLYWPDESSASAGYKKKFNIPDLSVADRLVLEGDKKMELTFDEVRWKVNGSLADRNLVDVLFATLQQVEAKRPVAKSMEDSVARYLRESGIKVSVYDGEETLAVFFVGGNTQKSEAYFLKEDETIPYVVVIPGYRVYVSGIFELEEKGWKDKYVFNFNWKNFQTLRAEFPSSPEAGFEVAFDGLVFSIAGMPTDTARLNTFLDQISLLTVDQYVDGELLDSLNKATAEMRIEVENVAKEKFSLTLFRSNEKTGLTYGLIGTSEVALFDNRKLTNLFRKKDGYRVERQ